MSESAVCIRPRPAAGDVRVGLTRPSSASRWVSPSSPGRIRHPRSSVATRRGMSLTGLCRGPRESINTVEYVVLPTFCRFQGIKCSFIQQCWTKLNMSNKNVDSLKQSRGGTYPVLGRISESNQGSMYRASLSYYPILEPALPRLCMPKPLSKFPHDSCLFCVET